MSGDTENASVWDDADVFVSFDLDAAVPATVDDDFGVEWELVGFLDGAAGFAEDVSETATSHMVWGQGAIKRSYKDTEVMVSFTARERNETTERLARPNNRERVLIAFEVREGTKVFRKISREYAIVSRNGSVTDNEDALTGIPLQAWIAPDTTVDASTENQYFTEQATAGYGS